MSSTKLVFFLQDLHHDHEENYAHGWYQAALSDGVQEATMEASSLLSQPLLVLLWAVRLLLLGGTSSTCSWWKGSWYEQPEEHRWLLSRHEEQIQIHIVRFSGPGSSSGRSDEQGETVLRLQGDLLQFAKRLSHQLGQLIYQEQGKFDRSAVPLQDYQNLQEAIAAFEHTHRGNQGEFGVEEKSSAERITNP